jgi:multicomponent Na+:H+ antiporter subunit D
VALFLPIWILAGLTVAIGLAAEPLVRLTTEAAGQLLAPAEYIRVVLGGAS